MKKRILSLSLAVIMLMGIFAGCGKKEESSNSGSNKLIVGLPTVSSVTDYDENYLTERLEEISGAEIEFMEFSSSGSEAKQQLTLMCNAKEALPDVLLGFTDIGHYTANQFGEDGFFIDLTDLIDKYAVNYKEQLAKLPKEKQEYIKTKGTNTTNGKFYGMPTVTAEAIDQRQSLMYINQTWLDKLGLQAPKNLAELEKVLYAFKTQDPNGNGKADEIPMLLRGGGTAYIVNAYICYESAAFNVTDGKVWDPVQTTEFRQGLIKANDLMQKELFSELSFTVTDTEYKKLISPVDEPCKVGIFSGHHESNTNAQTDILNDFVALGDMADETGKGGYSIVHEPSVSWSAFITKDCENTELAMKFLDTFYLDEIVTIQRHGIKDEEWAYEEGKNSYGYDSYAKCLTELGTKSGDSTWGRNILGIQTQWNYFLTHREGEGRVAEAARLQKEQWTIIQQGKQREEIVGDLIYTPEEYDVREAKAGTLNAYLNEQISLFVKGIKNPKSDADWNAFIKDLKGYGREELIDIAQAAYDRKTK